MTAYGSSVTATEQAAVRMLTPAPMAQGFPLMAAQQQSLVARPMARLSPVRERLQVLCAVPALAAILAMPLAGFLFAGLFLGELVGAVLGVYFAGLNAIFAWSRLPMLARMLAVAPCSDPATTLSRLTDEDPGVRAFPVESQRPAALIGVPQRQPD